MAKIIKGKRVTIGGGSGFPNGKIYDIDYQISGSSANNLSEYQSSFSIFNPSVNGTFNLTSDGYTFGQDQSSFLGFPSRSLVLDLLKSTVFFKLKTASVITNCDLFNSTNITEFPRILWNSNGQFEAYYTVSGGANVFSTSSGIITSNSEILLACRFNTSNISVWIDGNTWSQNGVSGSNTTWGFRINGYSFANQGRYFNGGLKRFLLFNRPLSDTEVTQVLGLI